MIVTSSITNQLGSQNTITLFGRNITRQVWEIDNWETKRIAFVKEFSSYLFIDNLECHIKIIASICGIIRFKGQFFRVNIQKKSFHCIIVVYAKKIVNVSITESKLVQSIKISFLIFFFEKVKLVREQKQISQKRGTVSSHWDTNGLSKKRITTGDINVINKPVDMCNESVFAPILVIPSWSLFPFCRSPIEFYEFPVSFIESLGNDLSHSLFQFFVRKRGVKS